MKKILVTGANGLLGQKLVYALLRKPDVQLIATSLGENRILEKNGYEYVSMDISDKSQVMTLFEKYLPDTVINTAAMTNVDACETMREQCRRINVDAVAYMVETLTYLKEKTIYAQPYNPHFIHLSTDFVFDGELGPYKEDDIPNPLSFYAQSKYDAEKIIEASSLKWAILRTIIVYGIVANMSRTNVVLWAKEALGKGQKINVVDDQFRTPTLAEDLAEACILAASKKATGIFHTSGKDFMSILELVYRVADFFGLDKNLVVPIKSNTLNQAAKRPPRTGFIITKAEQELGYRPHSFEEGLALISKQLS